MEPDSKLAQLVNWVRQHMDRRGLFRKSDFYAFARTNDMERSALMFIFRCRKNGTFRDRDGGGIQVLIPKDMNLEQFYKKLLKIKDQPVAQPRPKHTPVPTQQKAPQREKQPQKLLKEQKEPAKPASAKEAVRGDVDLADVVAKRLEVRFGQIDDTVASISSLVEQRISDLEENVTAVIVQELEKRIKQLEKQLEEFREKAEAFDLIKRDAWEIVQALEVVEVEKQDVKKVLKKFL